jgi:hypothetical protein
MKYNEIKLEGNNLVFLQAPDTMPNQIGVDGIREFLHWQNSLRIFTVKESDRQDLNQHIGMVASDLIEIYKDVDGREYARKNSKVIFDINNQVVGVSRTCPICSEKYAENIDSVNHIGYCKKCNDALSEIILTHRIGKK